MDASTKHVTLIFERFGDIRLEDLDASRVPPFPQESKSHTKAGLLTLMLFMMLPIVQSKASFPHHYSPQRAQTR